MKRRTLRPWVSGNRTGHHSVYVVLLAEAVLKNKILAAANPKRDLRKPGVYVGMTGLTPEERFSNHKTGIKDSKLVKRYGVRLMPELYHWFNPMPYDAALVMEKELAEELREKGYTVAGGH
jgi:hypothetical protein